VILSVDVPLQRTAQALLRSALTRRPAQHADPDAATSGGAIVVMDVRTGAVLAAASEPGFDPNAFSRNDTGELKKMLADAAGPMFDRVTRMALPPGSVFKPLTAVALLESGVDPREPYFCRGYLHQPDRWRCQIFARFGQGHESLGLIDALAYSCNVYFFHHAGRVGPDPLTHWAARFGFGRPTGIDLPDESGGFLPTPLNIRSHEGHTWREGDTRALAVGQGSLTATPLQIVRLMAAIANGGYLVTPHVVRSVGLLMDESISNEEDANADSVSAANAFPDEIEVPAPQRIDGLSRQTLGTIREGLQRVVAAPEGTAHDTVYLDDIAIAGKTGTAESGKDREDHAWFAGYVPADAPRVAFVVVLEHAGDGGAEAGPVAQRLVMRMQQLGYFDASRRSSPVLQADFESEVEE
jgi:penicillin-binding protein 2